MLDWIILAILILVGLAVIENESKVSQIMEQLQALKALVPAIVKAHQRAVATLTQLAASKADPAEIQAVIDQLKASTDELVAATTSASGQ